MIILLTNDDGIDAPGLHALRGIAKASCQPRTRNTQTRTNKRLSVFGVLIKVKVVAKFGT